MYMFLQNILILQLVPSNMLYKDFGGELNRRRMTFLFVHMLQCKFTFEVLDTCFSIF